MRVPRAILLGAFCLSVRAQAAPAGEGNLSLENGIIRVDVVRGPLGYTEAWFAHAPGKWHMTCVSGSVSRPGLLLETERGRLPVLFTEANLIGRGDSASLELGGSAGGGARITETIRLERGSPFARVSVTMTAGREMRVGELLSTYAFAPGGDDSVRPDFVFTPCLRPEPDEVVADHVFRSPAFILQRGEVAMAIVPDVRTIDGKNRPIRSGGDLQVESESRPFVSFGLMNWERKKEHVYYAHADTMLSRVGPGAVSYAFFLYARAAAPERLAYRDIVRFEWSEYGHPGFLNGVSPQSLPFASYVRKAWYEFLPSVALDTVERGVPVTLIRQGRLAWSNRLPPSADNDCWFNVWFNALRTAYGMHLYGTAAHDTALIRRSERVLNLALLAPRKGGLAPTIFYVDSTGGHWVRDQGWGGIEGGRLLPMFHNAWTSTWLLAWADILPERRPEIMAYVSGIARFLIAHQERTGVIPSWYDPATGTPSPVLGHENAETAGAALFLARYALASGDTAARRAAVDAMAYVLGSVVPERKWYDFETFFSCSSKPVGFFDSFTGQYPQNTLSMDMTAEACGALFALTGDGRYIERGSETLDYLLFYQQVWSPEWLSRALFGGFGVQNTDAEWSDSRQGYFALTLMQYYELTGRREYFERGVAALRAMFSLFESPSSPRTAENYGHSGSDRPAGVTGIHWGTGSSVVSVHIVSAAYGGAYVNVAGGWGAGIDGCTVRSVLVRGDTIDLRLTDDVGVRRSVEVKFGFAGRRSFAVVVNGEDLGRFTPGELERGIAVTL